DSFSGALARYVCPTVDLYHIPHVTRAQTYTLTLVFTGGVKFEIKKLTVTVTPTAGQYKIYGAVDPTLTYTFAPALIAGDAFSGRSEERRVGKEGRSESTPGARDRGANYRPVLAAWV